jgi:hypothetical protein
MTNTCQAELDSLEWAAIMGVNPMNPLGEADSAAENLIGSNTNQMEQESVEEVDIVVGDQKFGKVCKVTRMLSALKMFRKENWKDARKKCS